MRSKARIFLIVDLLHYGTRRFAPRAASAAHYARSQAIQQNANKADREVHELRCKLTTCKFQELHARAYQPGRRIMYRHACTWYRMYIRRKQKSSGRFPNKPTKKNHRRQLRAEQGYKRWEDMPSMSSEAGDT